MTRNRAKKFMMAALCMFLYTINGNEQPSRVKLLKVIYEGNNPYEPQDSTYTTPVDSSLMYSIH